MPPGFSDISHVCGKCHIKQQELFLTSPHAPLVEDGTFKGCVTCHSNHKIKRESSEIFNACSICHEEGDKAMQKRDFIFSGITTTENDFQDTKYTLTQMTRAGFHTEEEELLLEEAKTLLLQLPPIQHTLEVINVEKVSAGARTTLKDIRERLEEKEKTEQLKKLSLIPIWLFLAMMAIVFWLKRKNIESDSSNNMEEK